MTEEVTGIDIVRAQILIAEGATHRTRRPARPTPGRRSRSTATPSSAASPPRIRRTTSSPTTAASPPTAAPRGFGIRLDGGTAYSGAVITRYYDSLLVKVTAWAPTPEMAIARMDRGAARVPHPRREDQHRRSSRTCSSTRRSSTSATPPSSSTRRPSCSTSRRVATARRSSSPTSPTSPSTAIRETAGRPQAAGRGAGAATAASSRIDAAAARHARSSSRSWAQGGRRLDAGAEAAARHRHDDARRAPGAARHAHAHLRHDPRWRRPMPRRCRSSSARDAGAAPPSTSPMRFLQECPWQRLRDLRDGDAEPADPDAAARLERASATPTIPTTWSRPSSAQAADVRHRRLPRLRLAELGREHARRHGRGARDTARSARRRSATPATSSTRRAPSTT